MSMAQVTNEDRERARRIACGECVGVPSKECSFTGCALRTEIAQALADKGERVLEEAAVKVTAKGHERFDAAQRYGTPDSKADVITVAAGAYMAAAEIVRSLSTAEGSGVPTTGTEEKPCCADQPCPEECDGHGSTFCPRPSGTEEQVEEARESLEALRGAVERDKRRQPDPNCPRCDGRGFYPGDMGEYGKMNAITCTCVSGTEGS